MNNKKKLSIIICCLSVIAFVLCIGNVITNDGVITSVNSTSVGNLSSAIDKGAELNSDSKLADEYEIINIPEEEYPSADEAADMVIE